MTFTRLPEHVRTHRLPEQPRSERIEPAVAVLAHAGNRPAFDRSLDRLLDQSAPGLRIVVVDTLADAEGSRLERELEGEAQVAVLSFGLPVNPWTAFDLAAARLEFEAISFHFEGDLPEVDKFERQLAVLGRRASAEQGEERLAALLNPTVYGVGSPGAGGGRPRHPDSLRWMRHPCCLCTGLFRPEVFARMGALFGDFERCAHAHYRLSLSGLWFEISSQPLTVLPSGPAWTPHPGAYVPDAQELHYDVRQPAGAVARLSRPEWGRATSQEPASLPERLHEA